MASALSEIKVPALGESIREATVARWLKSVGDYVKADEVLVELETDKVTLEVTAPASGTLSEVRVSNGGIVSVGDLLGLVAPGEVTTQTGQERMNQKAPESKPLEFKTAMSAFVTSAAQKVASTVHKAAEEGKAVVEGLSPSVRKLSEELNINPTEITGTGKGNRVTKEDVINYSEGKTAGPVETNSVQDPTVIPPVRFSDRREERVKMSRLRQRIAERLKEAQNTAAILTTFNEVDMTAINAIRAKYKDSFEQKHGIRLGVMSFFVKACVLALKEFPAVNSEIQGDEIIYKNYYDIGVAVSTPQGLVVPVVRNAELLSFEDIEREIATLAQKAKEGKLTIAEMTGGTFTISNGGVFGSLLATPILNPPQTAILGMHKIQDRPVVIDGKIEIRSMMYIALSYDHRVIDGRESVTFLVRVKENLENPERLMLDM